MARVLLTGASRGLGLEFVRQYAAEGFEVIATCRDPSRATALRALAAASGGRVRVESLDVTDHRAVDALAERCRGLPIDILISNAGDIGPRGDEQLFGTVNYAGWRQVLEVNTLAPLKLAEAFIGHVAATGGRLVFISSTTGSNEAGIYNILGYCTSKAALNKAVTIVAREVLPKGVVAVAFCPGHVKTDMGGPEATLEASESVAGMRRVIAALGPSQAGSFLSYDGSRIPW